MQVVHCNCALYCHTTTIALFLLRSKYTDILESFPKDHEQTLGRLHHILPLDLISAVLSCVDSHAANKMMLDHLISNIKCKADLLDLCDQLDNLTDSSKFVNALKELRKGLI